MQSIRGRQNNIYKYFGTDNKGKIKCRNCTQMFSGSFSTTVAKNHLRSKHKDLWDQFTKEESAGKLQLTKQKTTQKTLTHFPGFEDLAKLFFWQSY